MPRSKNLVRVRVRDRRLLVRVRVHRVRSGGC